MVDHRDTPYERISDALVEHLPELREAYRAMLEWWEDEIPGPHVVYGDLLNPHIDQLLSANDDRALRRVFEYLEQLAVSRDDNVKAVVAVTVCEHLGADKKRLRLAQTFMGPATLQLSQEVERFWNGA